MLSIFFGSKPKVEPSHTEPSHTDRSLFTTPDTITSTPSNPIQIKDTIFVTPCLQELRQTPFASNENEQRPSKWEVREQMREVREQMNINRISEEVGRPTHLFPPRSAGYASDQFDKIWRCEAENVQDCITGVCSDNDITENILTKDGALTIPSFKPFGFESECRNMIPSKLWEMYTKFLCSKFTDCEHGVAFIVSHHNRLKKSFIPLIEPFYKKAYVYGSVKYGYANCFCLKVVIDVKTKICSVEIKFQGYPDKMLKSETAFAAGNSKIDNLTEFLQGRPRVAEERVNEGQGEEEDQEGGQKGGGGSYKYVFDLGLINLAPLSSGIIAGIGSDVSNQLETITIYLVRHGNSLHNEPVKRKAQTERLDSSLTPMGFYQAYLLGQTLASEECLRSSSNQALLCCSFLERTQLTGLFLLKFAGLLSQQTPTLIKALLEFEKHAAKRYNSIRSEEFGFAQFKTISPITNENRLVDDNEYLKFFAFISGIEDNIVKGIEDNIVKGIESDDLANAVPIIINEERGLPVVPVNASTIGMGGKRKTHKKGRKGRKTKKARKSKKVRKQSKNKTKKYRK